MEAALNSCMIGRSFPIGPTLSSKGVNFCLFSKNADRVELLLFDKVDDIVPKRVIALDPAVNRTYHYWHVFVPSLKSGQLYGYRITGPNDICLQNDAKEVKNSYFVDAPTMAVLFAQLE